MHATKPRREQQRKTQNDNVPCQGLRDGHLRGPAAREELGLEDDVADHLLGLLGFLREFGGWVGLVESTSAWGGIKHSSIHTPT